MKKIIFLDIDGVLNSDKHFKDNFLEKTIINENMDDSIESRVRRLMLDIDFYKVLIMNEIVDLTGAKIVITSSWRILNVYPYIESILIRYGLPIIGKTEIIDNNRGSEIRQYLKKNKVDKFVIIDDVIFKDFDELINYLVKTDFYDDGIKENHIDEVVKILGLTK